MTIRIMKLPRCVLLQLLYKTDLKLNQLFTKADLLII